MREGGEIRVQHIAVTGIPAGVVPAPREVLDAVGLRPDEPLMYSEYVAAKRRVAHVLAQAGYIYARVDGTVRVDPEQRAAAIVIRVDPGERARFGEVTIRGNRRVSTAAICARVAWTEGEAFDLDKLRQTREALRALDVFRSVDVDYVKTGSPPRVDVAITVRERDRGELEVGGGMTIQGADDLRLAVKGRGELTISSWPESLTTLRLRVQPGYLLLSDPGAKPIFIFGARAALERPDFLQPRVKLGVFASYSVQDSLHRPRAGVAATRPFWDDTLELSLGVEVEHHTLPPAEEQGPRRPLAVSSLQQSAKVDRRDDSQKPRSGWFAQLGLEEGLWFRTVSGAYVKGLAELRGYVPVGRRVVLAGRSRGGRLFAATPGEVPVTQRFFSGGTQHRGFGANRLAPVTRGEQGDPVPVGGSKLVEASMEVRVDVIKIAGSWLGGVVFADAGDVVPATAAIELARLHLAAGVGLSFQTPMGALRLELGRRLNRLRPCRPDACPDPDNPTVFHFSIGEAF